MDVIRHGEARRTEIFAGVFKTPKVVTDALEIIELELVPGAALDPHDMPCRVAFFVLEGSGTFTHGASRVQVPAGDMVHVRPGAVRFWANEGDAPLRILVVKSLTEKS